MNTTPTSRFTVGRSLVIAGLLLGTALALRSLSPERIHPDLAQRLIGVMMGAVVVLYSNEAPKAIPRNLTSRCSANGHQRFRRFGGWTLVLGGLAYGLTWIVTPIGIARLLSMALLGTAVLLVLARLLWVTRGPRT